MKYTKIIKSIAFVAIMAMIASCTAIYEDGTELANDALQHIEEISVDDFNAKLEAEEEITVIDIRQPNEYAAGNIEIASNIPRGILEQKMTDEDYWYENQFIPPPEKDAEIIIYCKSGARGKLATLSLIQLGYKNVKNLKGGWKALHPDGNDEAPVSSGGCGG